MKTLSLVIPVYNSQDLLVSILGHVSDLVKAAESCGFKLVETIVVDDGSEPAISLPECTVSETRLLRNEKNRGKGFSVRCGALAAKGEWVLMSDVDESVPLTEFVKLAEASDVAMVCASRYGHDNRPLIRRLLSRLFNRLADTGLKDSQCGFKLFNMNLMREAFESLRTMRFAFDVELILSAPSVAEVGVEWHGGKRSSLLLRKDAPRMLRDLVRIRWGM